MTLVNFGSGPRPLAGFVNIDLDPSGRPDVIADLARALPFADASVDAIFSEDCVAYLEVGALPGFLGECRRVLKPGGVMRILTPDLERLAKLYLDDPARLVRFWTTAVHVPLPHGTAADVVNLGMKLAGCWMYDLATFSHIAAKAGLDTERVGYRESRHPALRDLDLRKPGEAVSMYLECTPRA